MFTRRRRQPIVPVRVPEPAHVPAARARPRARPPQNLWRDLGDGERLAKRHQSRYRGSTIAELREDGVSPREIVEVLASPFDQPLVIPERWMRTR